MTGPNKKLIAAVEAYFADLRRVRASGGGTGEVCSIWGSSSTAPSPDPSRARTSNHGLTHTCRYQICRQSLSNVLRELVTGLGDWQHLRRCRARGS